MCPAIFHEELTSFAHPCIYTLVVAYRTLFKMLFVCFLNISKIASEIAVVALKLSTFLERAADDYM